MYFLSLEGDLVRRFRLGPEVRHGEAVLEVGAEVVHPGNGKHDIHPKLATWRGEIERSHGYIVEGVVYRRASYLEYLKIGTSHYYYQIGELLVLFMRR